MEDWGNSELARQRRESILEVGGAYLFEAPQSGVGKMLRFSDPTDATNAKDDDDARCDSGAHYSNDAHYQLKKADDDHCDN
jgi:hypothetical protein